ncbi:MAG: HAMP domain-containing histidine kinase [Lachnospiraceae bacterium]|nr:HAMP domain-containing histidine kinase [Lachnospiraceae bacterium]
MKRSERRSEKGDGKRSVGGFVHGIRWKITLGLVLIFLLSSASLYQMLQTRLRTRLEEQVTEEMTSLWQNANFYARQLLVTYGLNNDEEGFAEIGASLEEELTAATEWEAEACDCQGNLLDSPASQEERSSEEQELFDAAAAGRAVYRMVYDRAEFCRVTFVLPVLVSEKQVGILRVTADYSDRQQENAQTVRLVLGVMILAFGLAFILCLLLLNHFVTPLLQLSGHSRQAARSMCEKEMDQIPAVPELLTHRRDEIGVLAENYSRMLDTVQEQFQRIEGDRTQIQELLESRQEFFDQATHELKTPLTVIRGYAQLLQEDGGEDRELWETGLDQILRESDRLQRMVRQLLDLRSGPQETEKTRIELTGLARNVAESMELKARRYGNTLRVTGPEGCRILGQEELIRQLLVNLVDNAIKYGEENTPIEIETGEMGDEVFLAVVNSGTGLSQDELEHIFEPFYRVDKARSREQGSAGLGLTLCRKIAEAHGGLLTAESEPGRTVFRATFPRDGEEKGGTGI